MKRSPTPPQRRRNKTQPIRWIGLALLMTLLVIFSNREQLEDRLNLPVQPPSPEIERLAQATTMTTQAQRLFYRQDPVIKPRSEFLEECTAPEETIVLGCYLEDRLGDRVVNSSIIIQRIDDPQFEGIMEVTAAHEMLHAAYSRLSARERLALAQPLQAAAERVTNKRLLKVLDDYEATDTERYYNELHSHLGTELEQLGNPELDAHYQQYFGDRQRVVAYAQQSVRVISELDQQAEALQAEIEQLETDLEAARQQIEQTEASLSRSSESLTLQQQQLEQTQASAEAAIRQNRSTAETLIARFEREKRAFNQQVIRHNSNVRQHGDRVERFNQDVQTYRDKVDAYNHTAQENRRVLDSLRGSITPKTEIVSP